MLSQRSPQPRGRCLARYQAAQDRRPIFDRRSEAFDRANAEPIREIHYQAPSRRSAEAFDRTAVLCETSPQELARVRNFPAIGPT